MKFIFLLACLSMFLVTRSAWAASASTLVATHGETVVAATAPKLAVQVKIKTHEVQIGAPSDPRPELVESNCTYSRFPCSIVDRIDIVVNGKALFVPRSVYCDRADLIQANIIADEKGSVLTLWGGDASEAYIVKIKFDATEVKSRILSSQTEPNEPLQETIYHMVTLD